MGGRQNLQKNSLELKIVFNSHIIFGSCPTSESVGESPMLKANLQIFSYFWRQLHPVLDTSFRKAIEQLKKAIAFPGLMIEITINRRRALKCLEEGFRLLKGKLYSRATLEFRTAISLSEAVSLKRMLAKFGEFESDNDSDPALAIGMAILSKQTQDFRLANKLGNLARKTGDYQQAGHLYRMALRIDRSYELARLNLAASLGRVELYDDEIQEAISRHVPEEGFVLPPYENSPEIVDDITNAMCHRKTVYKAEKIKQLKEDRKKAEEAIESYEVLKLGVAIKKTEEMPVEPTYEEIRDELQKLANPQDADGYHPEENKRRLGNLFNLGLFAFRNNDTVLSADCFIRLRQENVGIELLDLMETLLLQVEGKTAEAIDRFFLLLREDRFNRYLTINLGLTLRQSGNWLNGTRYLIAAADLLDRSEGIFGTEEMLNLATDRERIGSYKKALKFLKVVTDEKNLRDAWLQTGRILLRMQKQTEAITAYQNALKQEPDCEAAKNKLKQIHDWFVKKSLEAEAAHRNGQAAALCEKALNALRLPKTIERAILLYQKLKKDGKVQKLIRERDELIQREREKAEEEQRQAYIERSRLMLNRKAYRMAADNLEKAFRMKVDKSVYASLVKIYRGLGMGQNVNSLMLRWEKMKQIEYKLQESRKLSEDKSLDMLQ